MAHDVQSKRWHKKRSGRAGGCEALDPFWLVDVRRAIGPGPYGIRLLNETLMWHVGSQVQELKKLVIQNKDALIALRTNFDKPDVMKDFAKRLLHVDSVLQVTKHLPHHKD